jgi:hypothetical protein
MFQKNTQNHEFFLVAAGFSLRRTGETPVPPAALSEQGRKAGAWQDGQ